MPTTLFGASAVASVLTRGWTGRPAAICGSLLLALGVAITIVGIRTGSALPLFLGSGVAGLGFGNRLQRPTFRAGLRRWQGRTSGAH